MSFTGTYERLLPRTTAFLRKARFWIDTAAVLRLNGFLLLSAFAAALLLKPESGDVSSFFAAGEFYPLVASFLASVAALYAALVFVPYAWFLLTYYILRRDRNQILFVFPRESCTSGEAFAVDAILQRKLRLLAGAIKFRLVFWNYDTTDWYYLLDNQKRKGRPFASTDRGALGSFSMYFNRLGRFRTRYSVVKFEDPLGLFSLPLVEREHHPTDRDKNFYIYSLPASPSSSSAPSWVKRRNVPSASEQRFKVAEDFFDTKRYEPADDSRRILWPVYSRSRALLVRIPERDSVVDADLDVHVLFYNSYLHMYAVPFHEAFDSWVRSVAGFLDSILRQRALTIRLFTDSPADPPYENDPMLTTEENLRRKLVSAQWHREATPRRYARTLADTRAFDRERILLVNPFVAIEELSEDVLAPFSACYLLSAEFTAARSKPFSLITRSERGYASVLFAKWVLRSQEHRLRRNRLQLAARLQEAA